MSLLDLYNSWNFKNGNTLGTNKTPKEQTEGKVAVDFLPNTYQAEVKNRDPHNKTVTQASADDATNGTFNTTTAFKYYSTLVNSPLKTFKSKVVHLYNAQGTDSTKYATSNQIRNTPGALYNTNS
jgi:hypothetical protein